ncbi:enoyl-CoA hydratase [Pigmentiphaga sp. NML080357]|nr:enoyl-CoA hydratase [Pigmentiphaga sp. NML080357]
MRRERASTIRRKKAMEDILVESRASWLEITINRPDKLNAIREQTAAQILGQLSSAEADRQCRAVILRGSEKAFCTGVDTSEQVLAPDEIFELWRRRKRERKVNQLFKALPEFTKPVIAAVEGYALGGGFELALLCDIIVAADGAQFGLPEARLGLMPGGAGTQTLPRLIGKPLAKELMWTGRRIPAAEALSLRLVNHVAERGHAIDKARELAQSLSAQAPLSVMFTKQAVERGFDTTLSEGMNIEADAFFALAFSSDKEEGLAAFREKRAANFTGR